MKVEISLSATSLAQMCRDARMCSMAFISWINDNKDKCTLSSSELILLDKIKDKDFCRSKQCECSQIKTSDWKQFLEEIKNEG